MSQRPVHPEGAPCSAPSSRPTQSCHPRPIPLPLYLTSSMVSGGCGMWGSPFTTPQHGAWTGDLTSLSLSFPTCQMETITPLV